MPPQESDMSAELLEWSSCWLIMNSQTIDLSYRFSFLPSTHKKYISDSTPGHTHSQNKVYKIMLMLTKSECMLVFFSLFYCFFCFLFLKKYWLQSVNLVPDLQW